MRWRGMRCGSLRCRGTPDVEPTTVEELEKLLAEWEPRIAAWRRLRKSLKQSARNKVKFQDPAFVASFRKGHRRFIAAEKLDPEAMHARRSAQARRRKNALPDMTEEQRHEYYRMRKAYPELTRDDVLKAILKPSGYPNGRKVASVGSRAGAVAPIAAPAHPIEGS